MAGNVFSVCCKVTVIIGQWSMGKPVRVVYHDATERISIEKQQYSDTKNEINAFEMMGRNRQELLLVQIECKKINVNGKMGVFEWSVHIILILRENGGIFYACAGTVLRAWCVSTFDTGM